MKTKKTMFSRLLAFCLALALTVAMGTSAFAAPITSANQTGSITIQGIETDAGLDLNIYKIIDVNMDADSVQPKEPVYTWNEAVAGWVNTNYATYIDANNGNAVTKAFSQADAADLTAFYKAMAAAIADSTITITAAYTPSLSETTYNVTISDVPMGQYLIVPQAEGDSTYAPATATLFPKWNGEENYWELNNAAVSIKGSPDDTKKEIVGDDDSVSIGDVIPYEVNALIPSYPSDATAKSFVIGDTMTAGLTFNNNIKVYFDEDHTLEVPTNCYSIATSDIEGETFRLSFNYDNLKAAANGATRVYLTYSATVNENAFAQDSLGNSVYTGVNNNPYDKGSYDKKPGPDTKAYTYGIAVTKIGNEDAKLAGAEFKLYSDLDCTKEIKFVGSNGVYTKATADQEASAATALVTAADGTLKLQGLGDGTYYLKETKAPAGGYTLPQNPVTTIVLTDAEGSGNKSDGTLDTTTGATGTMIKVGTVKMDGKNLNMTLVNTIGTDFELPVTGGMGTIMFTAVGVVLMAGGVLLVVLNLKRRKAAK